MTEKEFNILSAKLRPKLDSVVRSFARATRTDTDDIVQDALVTLWQLYRDGYPVRNPEALAVRIVKNICVSHYRKRCPVVQDLKKEDCAGGQEATVLTDTDDCRWLESVILSALSDTQKEYLRLRNEEQLSLDEMAALTGKPKTSIKSTISAARRLMLDVLKKQL